MSILIAFSYASLRTPQILTPSKRNGLKLNLSAVNSLVLLMPCFAATHHDRFMLLAL